MSASVEKKSAQVLNVPNQLTAARLVLSIVVFVLIPMEQYLAAMVVFVIAAGTDWIDGYWSRKFNQVTQLGRIFDPFVDKIIICGTFILLAVQMTPATMPSAAMQTTPAIPWYAVIAGWMAVVVVGREMLVTALRGFIEQSGGDFSANMAGKLKMVFQCAAVVASLLALNHTAQDHTPTSTSDNAALPAWLLWSLVVSVWLAVGSTVYSGVGYVIAAARYLLQDDQKTDAR